MARQSAQSVVHTNISVIEVAEGWLLDALLADTTAAKYIVLRLSETVAVVTPGALDALLARLRKLGHTPKVLEQ
jgi:EAL domain-containing protein (putative c-di-GMP-specific phosphodiesterase class I)